MCYLEVTIDVIVSKSAHKVAPLSSLAPSQRVNFATTTTVIPAPSPLDGMDDWSPVWYNTADLDAFRAEARENCRQLRSAPAPVTNSRKLLLARDFQSRGLEQRCCLERQKHKYLANRYIIRAQQKLQEEELAQFARKCTSWATELAVEEGARDFVRAYNNNNYRSKNSNSKRVVMGEEQMVMERRVRPRICVSPLIKV